MRARGFTLIEVLVALAIVAIGMAAVLETLTSSADTVVYLRDKTFANWIALNQIATVRLAGQQPAQGVSDGDVDFAGRKWHWHQEVTGAQLPGVARLDVSVRPADVTADKDRSWYATLTGIWGDAVGAPRGDLPDWGSQLLAAPAAGAPGTPASPGAGTPPPAQPTGQASPQGTP
ncbi:MAG TPA: type II secretion system minor pseudopilin GspI [Steroidobacteraceae bacterium]|jgi:general secretion pathway protein I|nr:type II secretion system minor pseudopilin GspI [Steroidobacteraceae bacterium]